MSAPTTEQPDALKRRKRRSPKRPGFTIPEFSKLPEVSPRASEPMIRAAVDNGLISYVWFNGLRLIPVRERAKWNEIWGEPPAPPQP
jgi:hypothetical protein